MIKTLHGLQLQVKTPSHYQHLFGKNVIDLRFVGMSKDALGQWKPEWWIQQSCGATAKGYRSLNEAAEHLSVSIFNQGRKQG